MISPHTLHPPTNIHDPGRLVINTPILYTFTNTELLFAIIFFNGLTQFDQNMQFKFPLRIETGVLSRFLKLSFLDILTDYDYGGYL